MQESHTSLIVWAESSLARKYKITRYPLKGALHISEVVQLTPELCLIKLSQTDCLKHFDHFKSTTWNKTKV
jgi:hypothetical protein